MHLATTLGLQQHGRGSACSVLLSHTGLHVSAVDITTQLAGPLQGDDLASQLIQERQGVYLRTIIIMFVVLCCVTAAVAV